MIDEIITGISLALDKKFNEQADAYTIYSEKVEQGLKEPCFIISPVEVSKTPFLNLRSKCSYEFDIVFISKSGTQAEMLRTADLLFPTLNMITLLNGGMLLGYDMRYEITDDVLHFFVRYPVVMKGIRDETLMDSLEVNETIE